MRWLTRKLANLSSALGRRAPPLAFDRVLAREMREGQFLAIRVSALERACAEAKTNQR